MQALKLVAALPPVGAGHVMIAAMLWSVVSGKLRVDMCARIEQLPGAGEVGHIGKHLAENTGQPSSLSIWRAWRPASQ